MERYQMVWIGNGWRLVRGIRRIRRGKNKNKLEVKYLKGCRLIKKIVSDDCVKPVQ